ncbi:CDR ABC transporter [Phytophthora cactorum]|nr:CDR ABC transporter [Phytophthora cactorum]
MVARMGAFDAFVAILTASLFQQLALRNSEELVSLQMTNVPPSLPSGLTVKEYLEDVFLMKHSEIWRNCAIVLAFLVFFRVLTLLAMRFVNHQKR